MGLLKPFGRHIKKGQRYGDRPGLSPNPPGGHNGDDWLTQVGEPVRAAGDYEVVFAGEFDSTYADNFGWNLNYGGKMVVLNIVGETGPYVEYGHLSELRVKTGDKGKRGDIIALTGNTDGGTGVSTGPHCHVGVLPPNFNLNTNTYGRVNPDLYLTDYWEDEETQEDELSADMPMKSKDGKNVTLEIVLNSIDGKVEPIKNLDRDLRADLEVKGRQINQLLATQDALIGLLANQNNLTAEEVRQALTDALKDGITVTLGGGASAWSTRVHQGICWWSSGRSGSHVPWTL